MGAKYTEAQKKATEKYLAESTDRLQIRVSKGKKEKYKAFAEKQGVSLNGLICELLERAMADKNFDAVLGEPIKDGVLKGFRMVNTKIR